MKGTVFLLMTLVKNGADVAKTKIRKCNGCGKRLKHSSMPGYRPFWFCQTIDCVKRGKMIFNDN